jgi:hypothetical protein
MFFEHDLVYHEGQPACPALIFPTELIKSQSQQSDRESQRPGRTARPPARSRLNSKTRYRVAEFLTHKIPTAKESPRKAKKSFQPSGWQRSREAERASLKSIANLARESVYYLSQ